MALMLHLYRRSLLRHATKDNGDKADEHTIFADAPISSANSYFEFGLTS
jgi:hypothetical protein